MRVELSGPTDASGELDQATYRVLLWNRPAHPNGSWLLDEWDVFEARDALEVIGWAKDQSSTGYEVAVIWPSYSIDANGESVMQRRYFKIAGSRDDQMTVSREILFSHTGKPR